MTLAYKNEPYESPVRFGPNGAPVLAEAQSDLVRAVEKPAPPLPDAPVRRRRQATDAPAPPSSDVNVMLLDAASRVFTALTQRIAYHEAEARKLREALKPYSEFGGGEEPPSSADDLAVLMKAIEQLKGEQR
jgi:hypothetical protein